MEKFIKVLKVLIIIIGIVVFFIATDGLSSRYLMFILETGVEFGTFLLMLGLLAAGTHIYIFLILFLYEWLESGNGSHALQIGKKSINVLAFKVKPSSFKTWIFWHKWAVYIEGMLIIGGILIMIIASIIASSLAIAKGLIPAVILLVFFRFMSWFQQFREHIT